MIHADKKARAKVTAVQSVEITGSAYESNGAPLLLKEAKVVEKVEIEDEKEEGKHPVKL